MEALPFFILSLGAVLQPDAALPDSGIEFIRIAGPDQAVVAAQSFSWDSLSRVMLYPVADSGYAFASIDLDSSAVSGDTLTIYPAIHHSNQVTVQSIGFYGDYQTRPGLLARLIDFTPFTFSYSIVDDYRSALTREYCQVLDWEIIEIPGNIPEVDIEVDNPVPVSLNYYIEEQKIPNTIDAGVGYSQDQGVTGSIDVRINNLFGGRRRLEFSWKRLEKYNLQFQLAVRDPYPFGLPFGVDAGAGFRSYDSTSYHLEANAGVFFRVSGFELGTGYRFEQDRSQSGLAGKNLVTTSLTAPWFEVAVDAGQRKAERKSAYFSAQGEGHLKIPLPWMFSFSLFPQAGVVASRDSLYASELIAVGGARSLRGYFEEEFRAEYGVWSRQELGWGSEAFSIYPLFDLGWIDSQGWLAGYGAGIWVATPVGRVRIDAALPWGSGWQDGKLHLSLTSEF